MKTRATWPLLLLAAALSAHAEPSPAAAAPFGLGPQGFYLGLPESGFQLRLRGVIQADGRFYEDQEPPVPNQFLIRRARIYIEGTVADFADFRLMPDFGLGQLQLLDAWVDLHARDFQWARLMGGKLKSPFGLERLQAEQDVPFVERGLPTNLAPDRDVGVMLHAEPLDGAFTYALAVVLGAPDNAQVDRDVDTAKDGVLRLFLRPLRGAAGRPFDVGVGGAASLGQSWGSAANPFLPAYVTPGQLPFFSYATDAAVPSRSTQAAGRHLRLSPQGYAYLGPFGVLVEDVVGWQEVARLGQHGQVTVHAAQVEALWVLTGEHPRYTSFAPARPFSPGKRQWGAVMLVARYGQLTVAPSAFRLFADPAQSARAARSWTVGVDWLWTRNARFILELDRTTFEGGAAEGRNRAPESALLGELQVSF